MSANNNTSSNPRAFRKGLRGLRVKDVQTVKQTIMGVLGITTPQSFIRYSYGKNQNLDIDKASKIEQVFAAFGVNDCWGL